MMIKTATKLTSALQRKLKWGVAGCGNFVENSFLPSLLLVQRSKLISVYSHNVNRAKIISSKFGGKNAYDDFDKFLQSDINIVYVAGVNSDHYWQVIKSAKAGKHILCERPIAISSAQAKEMIQVCQEKNVVLMVNHLHRFHPLVLKAKELIDKKLLGKIISISISYNIDLVPSDNFRLNKELNGGGVLRDLGCQVIDLMRYFCGEIIDAKAYMDNLIHKSDVEDFVSAIVKFEKGGYGNFNVSYNSKKSNNRIIILGYNGSITIENFLGKKNLVTKLVIELHGEGKKIFRKRTNKVIFMIRSVQKTILKNESPKVTGEVDLENLKIIEKIESQCLNKN